MAPIRARWNNSIHFGWAFGRSLQAWAVREIQKITKLQVRVRSSRGLCGYNSNLVIKRRAGAVFPPLLSAGVIMPRGGAILSILAGKLGGVGRHGLLGNNSKNNQITSTRKKLVVRGQF